MSNEIESIFDQVLSRFKAIVDAKGIEQISARKRESTYKTYAISNFRGGIGKSTLSFNIAYELSVNYKTLLLDACPQENFSQAALGDFDSENHPNIYNVLVNMITASSIKFPMDDDLLLNVNLTCSSFKHNKKTRIISGSNKLFLFPSLLYSQLAQYKQLNLAEPSQNVLLSMKKIIESVQQYMAQEKTLIDASPFFVGGTHLAWCAAEALIIPVRVDTNSIKALHLTLEMLSSENMDFKVFNKQGSLTHVPKIHAIVMTHCGWNRQSSGNLDSASKFFIKQAIELCYKYKHLFTDRLENCFYLWDDFLGSGRISGNQRIPIAKLEAGKKYPTSNAGSRMEVNTSVERYKKEIFDLSSSL